MDIIKRNDNWNTEAQAERLAQPCKKMRIESQPQQELHVHVTSYLVEIQQKLQVRLRVPRKETRKARVLA